MNMARVYWLLISAASGAAVLALEVLAARAMTPSLGSGPVAWSALLAVALGMLAAGNLLGGLLSEWVSACGAVAWSWAAASLGLVALSQYYAPAMQWSAGQSLLLGAAAAALITQAVPLLMLGLVTPVILRQEDIKTGRWAGLVLAAGSGGGIGGALGGGLLLLPDSFYGCNRNGSNHRCASPRIPGGEDRRMAAFCSERRRVAIRPSFFIGPRSFQLSWTPRTRERRRSLD